MNTCTNILGIPVTTLKRFEVVTEIQEMMNHFKRDGRSRYIATLNMDFLSNCFSKLTFVFINIFR